MEKTTKEKKARATTTNFTIEDEHLLVQLVISAADVLVSKKSDQFTNAQKNEQWKNLAKTFNSSGSTVSVCVFLFFSIFNCNL